MLQSKKLLSITFIFAALILGCETPDDPITPKKVTFDEQLSFTSSVHFWNQEELYNDIHATAIITTHFNGTGVSNSKNLENFTLSLFHVAVKNSKTGNIQIREGRFEILGDECRIYGTYEGQNVKPDIENPSEFLFNIDGGSGFYSGATGYLIGWRTMNSAILNTYSMGIRGTIKRKLYLTD